MTCHNPPTYDSGKEPKYCRVCGAPLVSVKHVRGYDQETGEPEIVKYLSCSVFGDDHCMMRPNPPVDTAPTNDPIDKLLKRIFNRAG